jgi:hypothetical protein
MVNKAISLGLTFNAEQLSHLDFDRLYVIKAAYDEVMAAKLKKR